VGVAKPEQNRWWWDVLRHGRASPYASYFDIDWAPDNGVDGRIALPLLGSDDDLAGLVVDGDVLRLGGLMLPIAPGTGAGTPAQVHDRQHYRLIDWHRGLCGYRRFFAITSLAALRQEDRHVFDATHVEVARWFTQELVDGLRIDHPDGLSDPAGYLTWLVDLVGQNAWIVVEKILAADEQLEPTLPVAGTTGYDALREIGGLFIDPGGADALTRLFESADGSYRQMGELARQVKTTVVTGTLASELGRLHRVIAASTGVDHPRLPAGIARLVSNIGVYRSDYRGLVPLTSGALGTTAAQAPELAEPLQLIAAALTATAEPGIRLQQLCGAATAKSLEDCVFYRDARLVSLNEVGGEPRLFGVSAAEFHHRAAVRARLWPLTMTTLSTHDTKRGEDVRARIGVLSQVATRWADHVEHWESLAPSADRATGLFLWQNIFGVWPPDGDITTDVRDRLHSYAEKAIREAAVHTSWIAPNTDFEAAVHGWLDAIFDGPVATELTAWVAELDPHARNDSLAQKLVQLTVPGVPDVYQGTELWDDSLVDPDNRRPVDFAARRKALATMSHPKIKVTAEALRLRRRRPDSFLSWAHTPLLAGGEARAHVVAFMRGSDVVVAVSRWTVRLAETGWGNTVLPLPLGHWIDLLSGRRWAGAVRSADLFAELPVALLEHDG
jgi:(1->4)-alpha-D-glucan 1-alpha-D-glucosylmutase